MYKFSFPYIKSLLLWGGMDKKIIANMRGEIFQENRHILIPMSIIATIVFFVLSTPMITVGPIIAAKPVFMFLFSSFAILAGVNIAYKNTFVTYISVIVFCYLLLGGGIAFRYLNPDLVALNFFVYLLIVSFLFTVTPLLMVTILSTSVLAFCFVELYMIAGPSLALDMVHTCVYAPICIIIAILIMRIKLERYEKIYQVRYLSARDSMTGLLNRGSYDQALKKLSAISDLKDYCIIILDVDGLKGINDSFGHTAGDELIIAAAKIINTTFSSFGACYRIGGDEFAVIANKPIHDEQRIFTNFINESSKWKSQFSDTISLSISYGIERFGQHPEKTIEEVVKLADRRMYIFKEKHYGQIRE